MNVPSNVGQQGLNDATSHFNVLSFLIEQIQGRAAVAALVKIIAVTNDGDVAPVGFVDVHPLVNQQDGAGNVTPHGDIFNMPYLRLQGGSNAIIIDPQVGDIGLAVICDEDISAVKATKAQANPGTRRRFDLADGVYLGGVLNGTPAQYLRFTSDGLAIADLNGNAMTTGPGGFSVTLAAGGDFKVNGISVINHVHGGVQAGIASTLPPTAGT